MLGQTEVQVSHNEKSVRLPPMVIGGKGPSLLGRNWIKGLGMEVFVNHLDEKPSCSAASNRFHGFFQNRLGCTKSPPVSI